MNVCVCVHVHVHAQLLSHPEGMAMLQVWSLVGRGTANVVSLVPKLAPESLKCQAPIPDSL